MRLILLLSAMVTLSMSQLRVVSEQVLPVPKVEIWSNAIFSPDGKDLFLTNPGYDGIWKYSLSSGLLKEVTNDQKSGYQFVISNDGKRIAYRRTVREGDHITRIQESVELDLISGEKKVMEQGNSISTPVFISSSNGQQQQVYSKNSNQLSIPAAVTVLGIEDTKIALLRDGKKISFNPMTDGMYLWPVLSPDKKNIAAVEMSRGAFVVDLENDKTTLLGKCNAPQWTRDGNWLIGMDDKDDGHTIYASEIIAVSKDGKQRLQITSSPDRIELFPSVSPTDNSIAATTTSGEVIILMFEEIQ